VARLRLTLALLALGIAVPAALIVHRALESLDLENAVRHEAVADRVFDETERALSDFIVREEARPPSDYAPDDGARFARADEPFILGWFELPPNGAVRVVLARGNPDRVRAAVSTAWGSLAQARSVDEELPAPGRTRAVGKKAEAAASLDELERPSEATAYQVLDRLNLAQELRRERKSKARQDDFAALGELADRDGRDGPRGNVGDREKAMLPQAMGNTLEPIDAGVDPLIGRTTPDGSLVLVRSVWRRGGAQRQGVVLDRDALAQWLEQSVLVTSGLGERARLDFGAPGLPPRPAVEHRYLHRFAEPFDALVARLDLDPLPGPGGPQPIYSLSLLLAGVGIVGLFAVQRMARVVVDYAQRRSDFVASVSHELKTPLTAIRMYAEMLRDGLVQNDAKREEYYATIAGESERLSRLIDNVLELSRLEQDRRKLDLVVGPLDDAVREASDKLRPHAEREGFRLRLDVESRLPAVRYDRDALTQIVFNLVDNALKYAHRSDRREVVIAVRSAADRVELRVRDFGPGVPPGSLSRVFEPFYRGGDELTRTAKGTGIGLALVRELAEAMGASVRGHNPAGGGFEVAIAFESQG